MTTLLNGLRDGALITRTGRPRDRRTASLLLTPRWPGHGEQLAGCQRADPAGCDSAAPQAPGSFAALGAALPALAELTAAVDALADSPLG